MDYYATMWQDTWCSTKKCECHLTNVTARVFILSMKDVTLYKIYKKLKKMVLAEQSIPYPTGKRKPLSTLNQDFRATTSQVHTYIHTYVEDDKRQQCKPRHNDRKHRNLVTSEFPILKLVAARSFPTAMWNECCKRRLSLDRSAVHVTHQIWLHRMRKECSNSFSLFWFQGTGSVADQVTIRGRQAMDGPARIASRFRNLVFRGTGINCCDGMVSSPNKAKLWDVTGLRNSNLRPALT